MKKIIIPLLFITCLLQGQSYIKDKNGFPVYFMNNSRASYIESLAVEKSWINFENLTVTSTTLTDLSGNGNNWSLENSNCTRFISTIYGRYARHAPIPFNRNFIFSFYASLEQDTAAALVGGYNSSNYYIGMGNTSFIIRTPSYIRYFGNIHTPTDSKIRQYIITITPTTIKVRNNTDNIEQTIANPFGNDSIQVDYIGRRGNGSFQLKGKLFGLNFNGENIFPMSEGYGRFCYNAVYGDSIYLQGWNGSVDTSFWKKQSLYHWNLTYGYSTWEDGPNIIRVPYHPNHTYLDPDINFFDSTGAFVGGTFHNGAETGIKPPISLLPYDYNNFLFDTLDVPNVIYYENMSENVGNRIFQNVSIPYQYKDLKVYNKAAQ